VDTDQLNPKTQYFLSDLDEGTDRVVIFSIRECLMPRR